MSTDLVPQSKGRLLTVPVIIADAGDGAAKRFPRILHRQHQQP
ncbi:hypothetical protein V5E97_00270 [Singulisphaera sp. Ch08]|uniref:Uncharacterized protein n=1 Tax=Singulisphaera sp. Ch08 TaxID=3120278 RepID=A0AAU7CHH2_9BACT